MTKIEEYEYHLIHNGAPKDRYAEYEKLLKRVNENSLRLQHCYTTAVSFPPERSQEGIELIEWGLERFPDTWFSTFTAYRSIGTICERCENYPAAYEAYRKAESVLSEDQIAYRRMISGNLLWVLLHIDHFKYSEQLERYYVMFKDINSFQKAFINNEFRLAVAEIVIFLQKGMQGKATEAYKKAIDLCSSNTESRIQKVLDKHKAIDTLKITPECVAFLKTVKL